ncbi:MAG: hypothetical protein K2K19_03620 [Acetatifactor sp.]|nr:hypothetical protein [Acetatifactor sp.]
MDFNGTAFGVSAEAGYPLSQVPLGLSLDMMENEAARDRQADMTESEKERLLMRCLDARSDKEMRRIVRDEVPEGRISALYEGPAGG